MVILKQRIFHKKPPSILNSLDSTSIRTTTTTMDDANFQQRFVDRQEKILQQTKTDLMVVAIASTEAAVRRYQKYFDYEMAQLWDNYRTTTNERRLTKSMIDLMDEHLKLITERFQLIYNFKNKSFFSQAPTVNMMNVI